MGVITLSCVPYGHAVQHRRRNTGFWQPWARYLACLSWGSLGLDGASTPSRPSGRVNTTSLENSRSDLRWHPPTLDITPPTHRWHSLTHGEMCPTALFILAETLVRNGTSGAGRMAPPASTRSSARMKCVQEHSSAVNTRCRPEHAHSKNTRSRPRSQGVSTPQVVQSEWSQNVPVCVSRFVVAEGRSRRQDLAPDASISATVRSHMLAT